MLPRLFYLTTNQRRSQFNQNGHTNMKRIYPEFICTEPFHSCPLIYYLRSVTMENSITTSILDFKLCFKYGGTAQ